MMAKSTFLKLNSLKSIKRIEFFGSVFSKNFSLTSSSTAATNDALQSKNLKIRLFTSVCVERLPIITCDMNDLEQRYSNLINEINIKKSYLSNHELRHLKDIDRAAKKKQAKEKNQDEEDIVIETALDFEERCLKELKSIKFGERKLSENTENQIKDYKNNQTISYLKNTDHILDKKLILLVNDKDSSDWRLPSLEWKETDSSLRITAERTINFLNKDLQVRFLGNAPVGVYKFKKGDVSLNKYYFFKAQYKSGGELLAIAKDLDFVWIRKDELKYFIKDKDYLESIYNFVLDF